MRLLHTSSTKILTYEDLMTDVMSFTYKMNNKGTKTNPCGTCTPDKTEAS